MRSRFTIMTLIALLIASTSIAMTYAEPYDGNQGPTIYDTIKKAAEARQDELLYLLEEDISEDVYSSLLEAMRLMQLAVETSDTQESLQYYMDALYQFRLTWSMYLDEGEDTSKNTLKNIPEIGPTKEPDLEDVNEKILVNKIRRLAKFQEKVEEKYSSLYTEVEDMMEFMPEKDSEKLQKAFEKGQDKLDKVEEKVFDGEVDNAIQLLDGDMSLFNDLDDFEDDDAKKTVKSIEKMDDEARKIKIWKEQKENNGENASEENALLKQIKEEIKDTKEEYKNIRKSQRDDEDSHKKAKTNGRRNKNRNNGANKNNNGANEDTPNKTRKNKTNNNN